jgi:hypothetical protein
MPELSFAERHGVGSAEEWAELRRRLSLAENALREIQRIAAAGLTHAA